MHGPGHVVLALLPPAHAVEVTGALSGVELAEAAPREVEGGQVGEAEARGGLEKALVLTEEQALLGDLWGGEVGSLGEIRVHVCGDGAVRRKGEGKTFYKR